VSAKPDSKKILLKRILIVPLRFIGDTILTVPLIRNLRHHYPDAQIHALVSKTAAPLLETCPYLNDIVIEEKGFAKQLQQLQSGHYDAIFILRKSVTLAALSTLAGIPHRIGYDKQRWFKPLHYKRWGIALTQRVSYPSLKTTTPQVLSHLKHLDALGLATLDSHLELWATDEEKARISSLLEALGLSSSGVSSNNFSINNEVRPQLAILHLVSASHGKSFKPAQFVEAVQTLHQKGYQLVCTGVESDASQYELLRELTQVPLQNWAGKTSLRETFALYQQAQVILTVDSSPIHFAAAANIPKIVGVFGPTNEKQWGPYSAQSQFTPVFIDLPCRPCYAKVCEHNNCRFTMTGDRIAKALESCL
jgi:ADP-heptose:LPS heptosyltransferase